MTGNLEDAYIAKETPMIFYLNIHTALQQLRTSAEVNSGAGPRVYIFYSKFSLNFRLIIYLFR